MGRPLTDCPIEMQEGANGIVAMCLTRDEACVDCLLDYSSIIV